MDPGSKKSVQYSKHPGALQRVHSSPDVNEHAGERYHDDESIEGPEIVIRNPSRRNSAWESHCVHHKEQVERHWRRDVDDVLSKRGNLRDMSEVVKGAADDWGGSRSSTQSIIPTKPAAIPSRKSYTKGLQKLPVLSKDLYSVQGIGFLLMPEQLRNLPA